MATKNTKTTKKEEVIKEEVVKIEEVKVEKKEEKKPEVKKETGKTYTTKVDNEDLCKIVAEVGGTVTNIIKVNKIENPNKIKADTTLVIK